MGSNLAFGLLAAANDQRVAAYSNAIMPLGTTDLQGNPNTPTNGDTSSSLTTVEIYGDAADPLGGSANDYDLFVPNAAGTALLGFSKAAQTGTQDPFEITQLAAGYPAGAQVVITQRSGAARVFHLYTHRGKLTIATSGSTSGSTFGHNAAANTLSMAATYWNSAKTDTLPFTGAPNIKETFSCDGPRKIFFNPNGTPITPGNFLFATNGGTTLRKPDLAAADGVSNKAPGFNPFFGTSAAAPRAAGIAARVRQARQDHTVEQVKTAMRATALDSMGAGVDRDAGFGITMATTAVQYALTH